MSSGLDYDESRPDEAELGTGSSPGKPIGGPTSTAPDIERQGLRAAGQLVARTLLTRAITLLGTVALARLLTPKDFGIFAIIMFTVTVITVVGDLGVGAGLVQQREAPEQADLETVFWVQLALFGSLGLAAAIAGPAVAIVFDLGAGSADLALLLALTILLVPFKGVPIAMLSRSINFGPLAASEIVQQVAFFGVAVLGATRGAGVVSFGWASVAQSLVAILIAWAAWGRRFPRPRFHSAIAARLWRFGMRMQAAHVAAWARDAVVPIFGGLAGGVSSVGFLQFAWRNGQLVAALDEIVTRVGFPALSRLQDDRRRFGRATAAAIEAAVLVAIGIQAWLIATAPVLVPVVFSGQWEPAVGAFRFVAAGSIAGSLTAVIRTGLNAGGQSGAALRAGLISLAVLVVAFPFGVLAGGITGGGIAFLVGSITGLGAHAWIARGRVRASWARILRMLLMGTAAAYVAAAVVAWRPDVVGLVTSGLVYVSVYGGLAGLLERRLIRTLWIGVRTGAPVAPTA